MLARIAGYQPLVIVRASSQAWSDHLYENDITMSSTGV